MADDHDDEQRPDSLPAPVEPAADEHEQHAYLPPSWADPTASSAQPAPIPALAPFGWRALGFLIDAVLLAVVLSIVLRPFGSSALLVYAISVAVRVVYAGLLLTYWNGATLGMRAVKLTCVDATTLAPVTMRQAFIRALTAEIIAAASLLAGILTVLEILDLAWPIWDKRNQTIHDKVGGTVVLRAAAAQSPVD
jgi:uncharacterized RDD family membrane protein YckC